MIKFCKSPFLGINVSAVGDITVCCANQERIAHLDDNIDWKNFLNSEAWNYVMSNVAEGTTRFCAGCINKENTGAASRRQTVNKINAATFLDIDLGNTCNLWCAMCESYYSSKWYSVDKNNKLHDIRGRNLTKPFRVTKKHIDTIGQIYDTIESCNLKGGEPLYYKHLDYLINMLIEKKCKNLNIITNLTMLDESIFDLLKKIERVTFLVSIDGIGNIGNWIRYDKVSSSDVVLQNLEKLKTKGYDIDILTCPMAYNFYHLPDFLLEMNQILTKDDTISLKNIIVDRPLQINKLIPTHHKREIVKELTDTRKKIKYKILHLENLIDYTRISTTTDKHYQDLFIDYTNQLNNLKTINIWDHIPLLRDELNVQIR